MELKVWVEGIQRVICGVTEDTTCQDIVIALAHAIGRTGRFSLIEKWRGNERPIAPVENPLRVLHKWGEYAIDVQLLLIQTDTGYLDKSDSLHLKRNNFLDNKKDNFAHNFSPPLKSVPHQQSPRSDNPGIKRSSTFTGVHSYSSPITRKHQPHDGDAITEHSVSEESEDNDSSLSSSQPSTESSFTLSDLVTSPIPPHPDVSKHKLTPHSSLQSPFNSLERYRNNKVLPRRQQLLQQRKSHPHHPQASESHTNETSSSSKTTLPNGHIPNGRSKPPLPEFRPTRGSSSPKHQLTTTQTTKSSHIPTPGHSVLDINSNNNSKIDRNSIPNGRLPSYSSGNRSALSPSSALEKSVIQSNKSQTMTHETVSNGDVAHDIGEISEGYSNLMELVTIQQERLRLQESHISKTETEIRFLEEMGREDEVRLKELEEEIIEWETTQRIHDTKIEQKLQLEDELNIMKSEENSIKSEMSKVQVHVQSCHSELMDLQTQIQGLADSLEKERKSISENKKQEMSDRQRVATQIAEMKREITEKLSLQETDEKVLEGLSKQVDVLQEDIENKKSEMSSLENSITDENLTDFALKSTDTDNPIKTEPAVFKQLSRPVTGQESESVVDVVTITVKNTTPPDGIWV